MKIIRLIVFALFLSPFVSVAATNEFTMAAQLLAAAKAADVQQVQRLVNSGANVNFVDSTGVSIVCTALMNNDTRAAQILQMYGADASKCDRQIKQYNNRNKQKGSGGLFSGLSSAQTISLAAAGAAVVVGGLLLLTDVFDPGNENENSSTGDRPNNNDGNGSDTGNLTAYLTVPYSPAYLGTDGKINTSSLVYRDNLALWNPSAGGLREWDFNYFRPTVQPQNNYLVDGIVVPMQNYLLMMHGYSAFANEYLGQFIFRDAASRNPVLVSNDSDGGNPVAVSLVTDNGISTTGSAGRGDGIIYATSAAADAVTYLVDKYLNYNNPVAATGELGTEIPGFDFSGSGTALNPFAGAYDSALGKIVAGWAAGGRAYGDLFGFVPNGRLGIFRTGGGQHWVDVSDPIAGGAVGTLTDGADGTSGVIEPGDTITLNGVTYDLSLAVTGTGVTNSTIEINGTKYRVPEKSTLMRGVCAGDDCQDVSDIALYVGTDGFYYVNTSGGNTVDAVYVVQNGNIYAQKELVDADYRNFEALYAARSVSNVLANVSVLDLARGANYLTVRDMPALLALNSASGAETFVTQINSVYDRNSTDVVSQGDYANRMFNSYSSAAPILIMPAGEFEYGQGAGKSLSVLDASFENYAPALYDDNLNHMFMTVVAVQHAKGTAAADSISEYGNGTSTSFGPLYLSLWSDTRGTESTADDIVYSSRKCGVAGVGVNGVDPWCFSAAGATAEMATASAVGAVAALKGAFDYMSNPQIFMLMALTADGYLLGADDAGNVFTPEALAGYLQSMYSLPPEYYAKELTVQQYLDAFADVYGYGLINLERAMTPGRSIYFYDGNKIVSANGNAYWRAASDTVFRPSSVLNLRGATVSAPFFDLLQSADGKLSLPRVWENSFAFGATNRRALYMGDVLGEFKTSHDTPPVMQVGDLNFSMSLSNRMYDDGLGGLDSLNLDYVNGAWNFGASYQRYFTDGMSRFNGRANPVLGLATNAVVSDIEYKSGEWAFGARAFSGAITDEGLLENDPTISSQYMPAKLGLMQGGQSHVAWSNDVFGFVTSFGFAHESDTLLGAYTDGLLSLGTGDTTYVDFVGNYKVADNFNLMARATFAKTQSDVSGDFVLGMSDVYSNGFALGADVGNFEFSVAMPLAITGGSLQYAHAQYDVVETEANDYQLNVIDTHVADLSLMADMREVRFSGAYRHKFGAFTDGAFGFIYRVNPNHTDEFGNESIFMLKLSHRLGI